MISEDAKVCPMCYMNYSMNYQLSKKEDVWICSNNDQHRFKTGKDGFLKSV